jgi:glycosyltransferase involved in cell wall biosynthesis
MKLSIVIPCYNEKNTISEILTRVLSVKIDPWQKEIIVVDDGSTDGTKEILKSFENKIKVIYLDKNSGKGTAVMRGLEYAEGDYIIIQDADLEYDPAEMVTFLKSVGTEKNKVIYGSRNLHHEKRKGFLVQRLGVWIITFLTNKLYGLDLTDVWTCYKMFPNNAKIHFVKGGFEAELLFTVALARNGYKISEVAISHSPRDKEHGKKIRYRDGFKAIQLILGDRLANLTSPEIRLVRDRTGILCCPFCHSVFDQTKDGLTCVTHGLFEIDASLRPLLIEKGVFEKNENQHGSGINWLKSFFKQFPKIYYSIWHVFCPVMMLVNGPRMVLEYIRRDGLVADIGSGPERLGQEFINVDVFPFPEVDVVADATHLPFKNNSLDGAVSESLFEHVPDATLVAREMVRVVKPGGYIYVSAPFIHPYHASPDDFNRWTISGLKHMFPDLEIIKAGVRSGPWSALLMFVAYWLGVILSFGCRNVAPFLAHMFMLIFGPFKYFDYFFMKIPGSEAVATHLFILGKKK